MPASILLATLLLSQTPDSEHAQRLQKMEAAGIRVRAKADRKALAELAARFPDYQGLLLALSEEDPLGQALYSNDVIFLDWEILAGDGSIEEVASQFRRIAPLELPIRNILGKVDLPKRKVQLSYTLDGKRKDWKLPIHPDDPSYLPVEFFLGIAKMVEARKTGRRLAVILTPGESWFFTCSTPTQFQRLRSLGFPTEWVSSAFAKGYPRYP